MMQITINKSADKNEIVIEKNGTEHTYDLNPLSKTEKDEVRRLVVNAWCNQNGFKPIY